jgi:tryptophanyl-tRNA synthetase
MQTRVLTGITTSGTPHLGNYVGAIRPALIASRLPQNDSFFFLADYHALVKCEDPARVERSRQELTATWLACGLDPERVTFYRQSDIPEIPELTWLLTCVTSKGMMNRAHAYKGATDANALADEDVDAGINMGLFSYPILMAADILMFNAHQVPVGRDQIQHIEMARDIAQRFNHLFGSDLKKGDEFFVLPEAAVEENVAVLPGLDGRKMSKSYDNTIPLFEGGASALKSAIAKINTDALLPGQPKDPSTSHLVKLFDAFATVEASTQFHADLRAGLGWGDAKQRTCQLIETEIGPMRTKYAELMANPERLEEILMLGAAKARAVAMPLLARLRQAVGLRPMTPTTPTTTRTSSSTKETTQKPSSMPTFKQYRDTDGLFYFKLSSADNQLLLQSTGFAQGKDAGQWIKRLQVEGAAALAEAPVTLVEGVTHRILADALLSFRAPG